MKERMITRLPSIFAYYTIIILATGIYNLVNGNTMISLSWLVELFVFLVIFNFADQILEHVNFKSFLSCAVAETSLAYALFLVFAYVFHWVSFTPNLLLRATLLFILIAVIGICYMNYQHKLRAREINDLLQERHQS